MESIDLKSLNLTIEESRDIINFIAKKRGISTEKLLSTIKPNLKRKNNENLTTKTQQNMAKTQQKLIKTQQKLIKSQKPQQKLIKSQTAQQKTQQNLIKTQKTQQNLIKTQQKSLKLGKRKNTQNLTYEKPSKLSKSENLTSQTKKRIESIREKFKELRYKLSKSELKEIRKHLYNTEKKNELLELETTKEYLGGELDEKILESDDDDFEFVGIENVQDLFKILIYKPTIVSYLIIILNTEAKVINY